jgi:hypothetical protein
VNTSTATAVANSGKATKGSIMSKAKVLPVVVVTEVEFKSAIAGIKTNGSAIKVQLIQAALFISQCSTEATQTASKKVLALAYQGLQVSLVGKYDIKSANTWVARKVKEVAPIGFKWALSKSTAAVKKAASRATKAPAKAPAKTKSEPKQTITQLRDAWVAKEKSNLDTYRNYIPAGKIQLVEQATMAYIQTLQMLLA